MDDRARSLLTDLQALPLIDQHAHGFVRDWATLPPEAYRGFFSESREAEQVTRHVPHGLVYQQALAALTESFNLAGEADEATVLAARARQGPEALLERFFGAQQVRAYLCDEGYRADGMLSGEALAALLQPRGCQVARVWRLETSVERLLLTHSLFDRFEAALRAELDGLRAAGYVALKTIIAYRSGLAVAPPARAATRDMFVEARRRAERGGSRRLIEKALLDYVLWLALEAAARQELPVQVHAGIGDSDLDLLQTNPLLLRPVLEERRLWPAPLVLLHNYPYVREAAYLAHLYPQVSFDLSLAIPLAGGGGQAALTEALGLAPASKLLHGSDANGIPDLVWLGARDARRALARTLAAAALSAPVALAAAERVLWQNAAELYGLKLAP